MPLINCEIKLMLIFSAEDFLVTGTATNQVPSFIITDTKRYIPVVTL